MNLILNASDVASVIGKNPYCNQHDILAKMLGHRPEVVKLSPELITHIEKNITDTVKLLDGLKTPGASDIPCVKEVCGNTDVMSEVKKMIGTLNEPTVLKTYPAFEKTNRARYLSGFNNFKICGRFDGENSDSILEVKTRMNRFLGVPDRDMVQTHVYMKMANKKKCVFTENFQGESRETHITFNDTLWDEIIVGLEEFDTLLGLGHAE